jgi:hypothetical protein
MREQRARTDGRAGIEYTARLGSMRPTFAYHLLGKSYRVWDAIGRGSKRPCIN